MDRGDKPEKSAEERLAKLLKAFRMLIDNGHSLTEIEQVADYLRDKTLATRLWVTTGEIQFNTVTDAFGQPNQRDGLAERHRGSKCCRCSNLVEREGSQSFG